MLGFFKYNNKMSILQTQVILYVILLRSKVKIQLENRLEKFKTFKNQLFYFSKFLTPKEKLRNVLLFFKQRQQI